MSKNLITFGCSLTYGHGLKDCFEFDGNGPGPDPSRLAWPQLLADSLELNCINLSQPGSGNTEILHKIIDYKFNKEDLVVVFWSFSNRDIVFADNGEMIRISHFESYPYFKEWSKVHGQYDLDTKTWLCMHHAYYFFKSKNVKFYFVKLNKDFKSPKWADHINVLDVDPNQLMITTWQNGDYALDCSHPGESFHVTLANILQKKIFVK